MEKYKFLYKPLFFIFSLVFACWMVFKIEELSPSDFGKYESFLSPKEQVQPIMKNKKEVLIKKGKEAIRKLINDYKMGLVDSTSFNQQLDALLESIRKEGPKK